MKALTSKYKKEGKGKELKEPGKDLFKAFRPCYMRAFVDAKDYKADTGEIITGTEDATDDGKKEATFYVWLAVLL